MVNLQNKNNEHILSFQNYTFDINHLLDDSTLIRYLLENIPGQVFWKDKNLYYRGCNQNFAAAAGLVSPKEIIGRTDFDLPWHEFAELYRGEDMQVMHSRKPLNNKEIVFKNKNQETAYILVSKIPIISANQDILGILGIYNDITQQKKLQENLKKNKEQAELTLLQLQYMADQYFRQ
jgi:PAS domain S-box-containing protein